MSEARQLQRRTWFSQYRTLDVAENVESTFLVQSVLSRGNFELILMVKRETRHPIQVQFGSEFPAICNHCRVMAAWSSKAWKFCEHFWGKRPFMVKFSKFCSERFHRLIDRCCCVQISKNLSNRKSCVIYLTKRKT